MDVVFEGLFGGFIVKGLIGGYGWVFVCGLSIDVSLLCEVWLMKCFIGFLFLIRMNVGMLCML